ncbi:C40 family peptidase [Halomonas sp. M5N1S17]|uniref:NlpC/P60 family protein n=1 Tax=Halomonas alkalisoli TaxID=2907158 RepID=UPI001F457218|nr:NlpC/P60 family protein [Halomonas alkalisoli]MCE9664531.1 C40 family peptidase [Halomonas alkalisoli]
MTLMEFAAGAIGTPFRPHGRGPDHYDCYGLLVKAWRDVRGIELPDYVSDYPRFKDSDQLASVVSGACVHDWQPVEVPQPMDAVVIYRDGRPMHIGLYLGAGQVLHIEHGIEAVAEPVTAFRIEGYYRPRKTRPCA